MSDAGGPNGHGGYQKLPPGWDCKYDQATGNCYYINYLTKAMQLEDPRGGRSYKQLQNERCSTESIALQPMTQSSHHSSPFHVVYPSNNLTAVRAFQEREQRQQPALHNLSSSPLLSASSRGQLEMSSPLPFQRARLASNMSRRSTIQETSFTHHAETNAVVTKIQNMFPTADENHIRLLLKRYMKNIFPKADEMLLLDTLANADNNVQFASEKLISLGYIKRDMQQPHRPNNRPPQLGQDQEPGNDQGVQHIPLRPKEYTAEEKTDMEALFKEKYPQVAERIILMALESVNYAEDRATQILQIVQDEDEQRNRKHATARGMPQESCKTLPVEQVDGGSSVHHISKPHKVHRHLPSINVTTPTTATTQVILSNSPLEEQQQQPQQQQQEEEELKSTSPSTASSSHSYVSPASQSPQLPRYERLTTKSILARSTRNNNKNNNHNNNNNNNNYSNASTYSSYTTSMTSSSLASASASSITKAIECRSRAKTDSLKHRQLASHLENAHNSESAEFQSLIEHMATLGPNSQLTKGADENLLLADYVTWNGPNTALTQKQSPQGPDVSLLAAEGNYKPIGRNEKLCKGAKKELAKGSIYANIKCN